MDEQIRKNVHVREIDTLGVNLWPLGSFWQICATYFASSIIRALLIMQARSANPLLGEPATLIGFGFSGQLLRKPLQT
jgi:hypothetical protein